MAVCSRMWIRRHQVDGIVYNQQQRYHQTLADFDSVYACQNVDTIRAEDGNGEHVGVVYRSEIEELAEIGTERNRYNDLGDAKVDEVDDEEWDGGDAWDEEFVAPADVEEVVS